MTYATQLTKATRAEDVHREFVHELDAVIYAARAPDADGYRIFQWDVYTGLAEFTLPAGNYVLRSTVSSGATVDDPYATKAELLVARDALNPSDGYLIFASWADDGGARRLEQRPCLWRVAQFGEVQSVGVIAERANGYGRTDGDRF